MADTKISQLAVADSLDDAVKIPILESDLTNKSTTTNTFWNYIKNKSDAVYQPLDGDLSAIAALTTTGLIEKTGANTASIVTITSAGKNLLGDVSPNEQRTTLGLGSASTMTGPSGSIVGTTDNQILTNKTISADNNTLSGIAASSFVLSNASGNIDGSAAQKVIPAGSVVGTTDTQTLDNKSLSSLNGGPLAGFRNRIINGNFDFWQRGTSFTNASYTADRWKTNSTGTSRTTSQQAFALGQTEVPGNPKFYCRTAVTSVAGAGNFCFFAQIIESVTTFAGQAVTLSFYAKAEANKNIAVEFVQTFGPSGGSSSVTTIGSQLVALTTSWAKKTITVTLPSISGKTLGSDNSDTLYVIFWLDAGATFSTRAAGLGQQSGTFDFAQVQLEAGAVATPFEHRPYGVELALCQRYAVGFDGTYGEAYIAAGTMRTDTAFVGFSQLDMRASPTLTVLSGSMEVRTGTISAASDIVVTKRGSSLAVNCTTVGLTPGDGALLRVYDGVAVLSAEF